MDDIKILIGSIVIPNETILNVPLFEKYQEVTIKKGYHYEMFKEFCDKYQIPYEGLFTELAIVKNNHITINTTNDQYVFMMIPKGISEKQYETIKEKRSFFETFKTFNARIDEKIIEEVPDGYEGTIIDYFYDELEIYYNQKKEGNNGRR